MSAVVDVRVVVWVGRLPRETGFSWTGCAVVLDRPENAGLDDEDADNFFNAFDGNVGQPDGIGFYVWEGQIEWYDHRGSIPDGEAGCLVYRRSWRPARALEVWEAQASARRRSA